MGYEMTSELKAWLDAMPGAKNLPFGTSPAGLYSIADLYKGYLIDKPESYDDVFDQRVYKWTRTDNDEIRTLHLDETIAARLHDTAMDKNVAEFLKPQAQVTIGFMGGHNISRTAVAFARVARMARELRRRGFMIVTGGGPGLMEAANFGAFMAKSDDDQFLKAMQILRQAPTYSTTASAKTATEKERAREDRNAWVAAAAQVRKLVLGAWDKPEKKDCSSLGLPTWFYGAEPPNLFASVAGKYFFNSLREDGLVTVANGGLIFGKGDAGTVQEVFQNASYNYYRDAVKVAATPMVFYDINFWDPNVSTDAAAGAPLDSHRKPVFPLIEKLAQQSSHPFEDILMLSNDCDEIVEFITSKNSYKVKKIRQADQRLGKI